MHKHFDNFLYKFGTWFELYITENHLSVHKRLIDDQFQRALLMTNVDENGFPIHPCCPDSWMHCKKTCPK